MNRSVRIALLLLLMAALLVSGCTKKKNQPPGGTDSPPADTGGSSRPGPTVPAADVPAQVLDRLKVGTVSADKQWQAAAIATGAPDEVGVWVAGTDLNTVRRVATEVHAYAGQPRWTPWNTVLYAVENGLNVDVTWFEADPQDGSVKEFLPGLLKGKRALIQGDAFSPDSKEFVYSTGNCLCQNPPDEERVEVWLASTDGTRVRKLGDNILAGFRSGELTTAEPGK